MSLFRSFAVENRSKTPKKNINYLRYSCTCFSLISDCKYHFLILMIRSTYRVDKLSTVSQFSTNKSQSKVSIRQKKFR